MNAEARRVGPANASAFLRVRWGALGLLALCGTSLCGCQPERRRPLVPPPRQQVAPPVTAVTPPKPEPPKLDAAAMLFPRSPGDTWELRATADGEPLRITMTVADAKPEADGKTVFTVETKRDGELAQREVYSLDTTGIYRTKSGQYGDVQIEPPLPMLTFPWKLGKTWEWSGIFGIGKPDAVPAEAKFKLTGPEELKTPAKSFVEVYRLDQTYTVTTAEGKQEWHNVQWLAPNVGLVKQETDAAGQHIVAELVKYTVASPAQKPVDAGKTHP